MKMVMSFVVCWLSLVICAYVFVSTSEPFGVVFDRAKGGAVAKTAVDHGVNGQEVCHGSGKETSIWEWERETQCKSNGGDKEDEEDTGGDRTRSGRLNKQATQQEGWL